MDDVRLQPGLRFLDTPGAASILLVAGGIPERWAPALARIHDAMPHPRATLLWAPDHRPPPRLVGFETAVIAGDDPAGAAVAVYRDLISGRRPSEGTIGEDVDPAPWRGVGPYGQGGTGMTGGVPYGRPMAELGVDRDGLRLDVLPVAVGPFFPRFPAGLVLDVRFAGDLVLDAAVGEGVLDHDVQGPPPPRLVPFLEALVKPVPIADLELARARAHLRWLATGLETHGLPALATRARRLATTVRPGDGGQVARLARLVRATQATRWSTAGVAPLRPDALTGFGLGPVARATGLLEDVRLEDTAYLDLGFVPVVEERGDTSARWAVRLAEAEQSLDLAERASDTRTRVVGRVESPRGRLEPGGSASQRLIELVPRMIAEMEWGDAVAAIVSLDLDLEEAALARSLLAGRAVA